jgi:hypothetical protein
LAKYFVLISLIVFSGQAWAGQLPAADEQRPTIKALRLNPGETITVDGRLDEESWQRAEPAADFTQSDPQNGAPATERSEIRILFDRDNLYIGAKFFDSDPGGLLGNQMVRDGALDADDRFMWVLDPFNNLQSGYFFETNPAGAMGDAQLVASSGTSFGMTQNRAWNGIWLARVRRHEQGWTAEIEIPFRTLNFDPHAEAWGANFQRTVRRKNEEDYWSGWNRNQGLFSLAAAGRIEGITGASQGHGVDIKPYVVGTHGTDPGQATVSHFTGDAGLDMFYNVTPQLRSNLTINTDFAQTEVDDRQVNLTRFPLFFPEKRDFFLEGAGNFDFSRETAANISGFFSRRIGLTDLGRPQKIDYGLKLTGQAGRYDIGVMQVRTGDERDVLGEDFTIIRPKRRLFSQSYAGLIYTRRATRHSNIPVRQTIGADFQYATSQFRGSHNMQFSAFALKTPNGAKKGQDTGWGFRFDFPNDLWNVRMGLKDFQDNVDPAVGFIQRVDRKYTPLLTLRPRPKNNRWIRQVTFESRMEFFTNRHGKLLDRMYDLTLFDLNFHSGDSASVHAVPIYEYLDRDFRIAPGITLPMGSEYSYTRYQLGFATANRRTVSGSGNVTVGRFYSGHRRDVSATVNVRPRRGLLATVTGIFSDVELAQGRFSTSLLRGIVNTQFNPFISVSNNIQYDSVTRVLGWQSRFRWIVTPGNDIYVVWLSNWLDSGEQLTTLDRSTATKLVYTYRF